MLFRWKKNKINHKEIKKHKRIDRNITIYDDDKYVSNEISRRRQNMYTVSGVDNVDFPPEMIKRQTLTRPIGKMCPTCANMLYNTRLDGVNFYCPNCRRQYHRDEIK